MSLRLRRTIGRPIAALGAALLRSRTSKSARLHARGRLALDSSGGTLSGSGCLDHRMVTA
jgi:hypothetical protein